MTTDPRDAELPKVPGLAPGDDGRPEHRNRDDGSAVFDPEEHEPRVLGVPDEPAPATSRTQDPDRDLPPGQGQSLTDLLGEGAQEGQRDNYQWAFGLLGIIAFIALVAYLFGSVLAP